MPSGSKHRCLLVHPGTVTTAQTTDRFCGFTDPPLGKDVRAHMLKLREQLDKDRIRLPKIWYVSDRRRAIEAFEILTAGLVAPIVRLTDKLREINFGDYEGLSWEELPASFQRQYEQSRTNPFLLTFPRGESFRDLCERVSMGALQALSYLEEGDEVGIVGHEGSLKVWHMMAEKWPPNRFFHDAIVPSGEHKIITLGPSDVAHWRHKYVEASP